MYPHSSGCSRNLMMLVLTDFDFKWPALLFCIFAKLRDGVGEVGGVWAVDKRLQGAQVNIYQLVICATLVRGQKVRITLRLLSNSCVYRMCSTI